MKETCIISADRIISPIKIQTNSPLFTPKITKGLRLAGFLLREITLLRWGRVGLLPGIQGQPQRETFQIQRVKAGISRLTPFKITLKHTHIQIIKHKLCKILINKAMTLKTMSQIINLQVEIFLYLKLKEITWQEGISQLRVRARMWVLAPKERAVLEGSQTITQTTSSLITIMCSWRSGDTFLYLRDRCSGRDRKIGRHKISKKIKKSVI